MFKHDRLANKNPAGFVARSDTRSQRRSRHMTGVSLKQKLELLETSAANNEFEHVKRAEDVKTELKWTNSFLATEWRQPKKPDSPLNREVH